MTNPEVWLVGTLCAFWWSFVILFALLVIERRWLMDLLQKIDTLTIQLAQREREREKDFAAVVKAGETTCDGVHDIATAVNRLVDGLAGAFGITLEPKEKKKEGGK